MLVSHYMPSGGVCCKPLVAVTHARCWYVLVSRYNPWWSETHARCWYVLVTHYTPWWSETHARCWYVSQGVTIITCSLVVCEW